MREGGISAAVAFLIATLFMDVSKRDTLGDAWKIR